MLPDKGLFLDCSIINQPPGTWRNGQNLILSKQRGSVANEEGTRLCAIGYPSNAEPIGAMAFPDGQFVIWSDGKDGGEDRIGIVNIDDNYTDIIVDDLLGLDKNFPIRSAEFDFNFLQQRIVTWTDKNVTPKILNIDALPFTLNPDKSLLNPSDIQDINLFVAFNYPLIDFEVINNGGSISAGAYSLSLAYENIDGTRTRNTLPIKTIYITDDTSLGNAEQVDGIAPGTTTSKAINVIVSNVDTKYDYIVLIVFARINGQISSFEVKKSIVNTSSIVLSFIGSEVKTAIDLEDSLGTSPIYNKVGTLTKLNNRLYLADLESEEDIDFQSYANQIRIFYTSKIVALEDLTNSHKFDLPAGFQHGGVYAFYIGLIKNGKIIKSYHIPGRLPFGGEPDPRAPSAVGGSIGFDAKKYQIERTHDFAGHAYNTVNGVIKVTSMSTNTNMGFWENEDEQYPIGFPNYAGQKVRHHVFPTIRDTKQRHYTSNTNYGVNQLDVLGIEVTGINIPVEIQDKIDGWTILYAKKDYVNSISYGTDITLFAHKTDLDSNRVWSAGGNWNVDARDPSGDGNAPWNNDLVANTEFLRGHIFELLKDKPGISAGELYLNLELKYEKSGLNAFFQNRENFFIPNFPNIFGVGKAGGNISVSGQDEGQNAGGIVDHTDTVNNIATGIGLQTVKKVSEFRYIPSNIIDGNIYTLKNEEAINLRLDPAGLGLTLTTVNIASPNRDVAPLFSIINPPQSEQSYLYSLRQVKRNLYVSFDQQLLITCDKVFLPNEIVGLNIYGGDHFITNHSFICSSPRHGEDFTGPDGFTIFRNHITESKYNIGLRYEVSGDVTTKYYPKNTPQSFWSDPSNPDEDGVTMIFDRLANPNGLGFSNDYSSVNDYNQPSIFNIGEITTNQFPYRVVRSGFAGSNINSLNSWKTFLSNDFYESNRSRGRIENIFSIDDLLFIHHLYGLFKTVGSERLSVGSTEVFLGSGDIFSQQPKEPKSSRLGYLGTQNIFSCTRFEDNYAWIDQSQGRTFQLSKEGVKEISKKGLYNFFRDNTKINNTLPNQPIVGECIISGFDPKYNRLLFTKKSNIGSFTLSYSLDYDCWAFYHTYRPNLYFHTSNDMYVIGESKLHKFGHTNKAQYLEQDIQPSLIQYIFNDTPDKSKYFYSINWITELYNANEDLIRSKTFTHIIAETSFQSTGKITLIPHTIFGVRYNIRRTDKWRFNRLKDINSNIYKRKIMNDNYCAITLEYNNIEQNSLYLQFVDVEYRPSVMT